LKSIKGIKIELFIATIPSAERGSEVKKVHCDRPVPASVLLHHPKALWARAIVHSGPGDVDLWLQLGSHEFLLKPRFSGLDGGFFRALFCFLPFRVFVSQSRSRNEPLKSTFAFACRRRRVITAIISMINLLVIKIVNN
jgi:hypothetical protein